MGTISPILSRPAILTFASILAFTAILTIILLHTFRFRQQHLTGKFEFSEFSFKVNGKELKNADFKDAKVYKITVETVNSKGNSSEATYSGYAIRDVLKAAGVENATKIKAVANDGYEVEYTITDENAPYSLLAIEKDKEVSGDGTVWFAPCLETVSQNFARSVIEIVAE